MQHVWNEIFDNNDDYRYHRNLQKDLKIAVRGRGRNLGKEGVEHFQNDYKEVYDFGWIINIQTREKVWKMTYAESEYAGGAPKNRRVNQVISLPAGSCAAFFVTDDSHSERRWNAPPPYDPMLSQSLGNGLR